jgi:transcriptional regulator with XRE-family HTH domain
VVVGVSSEKSVGRRLRHARTSRGVELERAAEETRIHRRFLEALERDAPPEEFPAPMYARAFLREYAGYLGLDPEPLVTSYRMNHREPEKPLRPPMPIERSSAAWLGSFLALLSVGVLLAIAVFAGGEENPQLPRVSSPSPSPPTVAGEQTRPPDRGVRLTIRVVERASWIQVTRDGEIVVQRTFEAGEERTFRDRRGLDFVVGDAGAVRVTLNGKRMGALGTDGDVFEGSAVLRKGRARLVSG